MPQNRNDLPTMYLSVSCSILYFKPPISCRDAQDQLSDCEQDVQLIVPEKRSDDIKQQLLQIFPEESSERIERAILKNDLTIAINYLLDNTNDEEDSGKYCM